MGGDFGVVKGSGHGGFEGAVAHGLLVGWGGGGGGDEEVKYRRLVVVDERAKRNNNRQQGEEALHIVVWVGDSCRGIRPCSPCCSWWLTWLLDMISRC